MVIVQYSHIAGSGVYRRLEHRGGVPDPVLDKRMSRGNDSKNQKDNKEDYKNLILPVVPMAIFIKFNKTLVNSELLFILSLVESLVEFDRC